MLLKKLLQYAWLTFAGVIAFLIIFVLISLAPVDRRPVSELEPYAVMMNRLDGFKINAPEPIRSFSVGFGKVNITPREPVATAGYGKRRGKPYHTVHDSIFVRALVIDNGAARVAVVSADLLIMPPTVTRSLDKLLEGTGFGLHNTYLGATHSHNSIGHWGEAATRFIYGPYDEDMVAFIAEAIVESIRMAEANVLPATLKFGVIPVPQAVENRLIDGGDEDPYLRVLEVAREDSTKLALMSYAAHATCLSQSTLELSRDYPGMVVDALESDHYTFAMFLAGSVGSHKGSAPVNDWACMQWMADEVVGTFKQNTDSLHVLTDTTLVMEKVELELGDPQVKIGHGWKVRSWLFRAAFGEYDAFLTVLRIGDLVMLGTPCDFSGEFHESLDSVAARHNAHAMVTSFNGGYIGYMTPAEYYDVEHYETQLMNWYAPGTGNYLRTCLEKLMIAVSDSK